MRVDRHLHSLQALHPRASAIVGTRKTVVTKVVLVSGCFRARSQEDLMSFTWRRGLWVLAVLGNIFFVVFWTFDLAQVFQEQDDLGLGPEAWRSALTAYAIRIGVPA